MGSKVRGRYPQWQQLRDTGPCRRHCWDGQNPDSTLAGDTEGFTESSQPTRSLEGPLDSRPERRGGLKGVQRW